MDWIWIILGILLCLAGIAGSLFPLIPGPPLAYAGLLVQVFRTPDPFPSSFLWIWAGVTTGVALLDYVIPLIGTKQYGGSRYGMWGCAIGFIAGFWLGPAGIILGPFLGAFAGEWLAGRNAHQSFRAAWGSFIGFLFSSLLKIITCLLMLYHVIRSI